MKRDNAAKGKLQGGNTEVMLNKALPTEDKVALQNLVQLIAEMFDALAEGDNIYMTLGANRDKSGFLLTLNDNGRKAYAGGSSLLELCHTATQELL